MLESAWPDGQVAVRTGPPVERTRPLAVIPGNPNVSFRASGQKLFPLTQYAVIGFCGDVATTAILLGVLRRQLPKRKHKDIASLLQWLPRLFQSGVATLQAKKKRVATVAFMLAGIVPDRANVVERAKVVKVMKDIVSGNGSIQRSFVPDIVMQVMMTPPDQEHTVMAICRPAFCARCGIHCSSLSFRSTKCPSPMTPREAVGSRKIIPPARKSSCSRGRSCATNQPLIKSLTTCARRSSTPIRYVPTGSNLSTAFDPPPARVSCAAVFPISQAGPVTLR